MNDILLVFLLLSPLFVAVGIVCRKLDKSEKAYAQTVQELLEDVRVRNKKEQFPILYGKTHAVLDYLLMIGDEDETSTWACHMYNLGFMDKTMLNVVFFRYGNVFEEEQDGSEPIRQYAMEVLSNLIESKESLEGNEKAYIKQLMAEMQALGWYSHNDSDDFESFVSQGADALIGEHLDVVKELF